MSNEQWRKVGKIGNWRKGKKGNKLKKKKEERDWDSPAKKTPAQVLGLHR